MSKTLDPNALVKNPFPIRFHKTDLEIAVQISDRLCQIPSMTSIIRAACHLGMLQMLTLNNDCLLASLKEADIK